MDVFALRNHLIQDYASYIESFINISDYHIRQNVGRELDEGLLWPDPLLQLNPSFEPGPRIDELVNDETLHPRCRDIFRIKPAGKPDKPLRLRIHQADAIEHHCGRSIVRLRQSDGNWLLSQHRTGDVRAETRIFSTIDCLVS